MGFVLKVVGLFLLLGGLYGILVTIPKLFLNLTLDEINPLIIFGVVESGTPATIFDLFLSLFLIGIGIIFIKKRDGIPKISK